MRYARFTVLGAAVSLGAVAMITSPASADTYRQLKQNLRDNINAHASWTWARFLCVADCYAAWADQKASINVNIGGTSTGYDTRYAYADYLMVEAEPTVTVDLEILTTDTLDSVDLILLNDLYNPPDPGFGLHLGSDTDGSDGWSVTFDPDVGGTDPWVGFLVVEANFADHPIDPDDPGGHGDIAAIYITRDEGSPLPSPGPMSLLALAGVAAWRRRRGPAELR
jgi:MYXO-CTERM domain-containing protein